MILSRLDMCFLYLLSYTLEATLSRIIERLRSLLFSICILLEASELIYKIMGNNRSQVEVGIRLDKEFYFAGDTVNGSIYVNAKKKYSCSMIVLYIQGVQTCEFTSLTGNQPSKGLSRLFNANYILQQFPHNHSLSDQHVFPFIFKLMDFLPGSYNQTKSYKAQIRYTIRAVIHPHSRDKTPIQNQMEIVIRERQRQGDRMLFGECFSNCKSLFCINQGISRVTCFFQRNYYFPQDECIMICQVDNIRCGLNINTVKCSLVKEVTLVAANGDRRVFTQILNNIQFSGAVARQAYYGDRAERKSIKLVYKDSALGVHPTTNGRSVKCEYYIIVKPEFGGCGVKTSQNEFKVRLVILQPTIIREQFDIPDNWRPSIEQSVNILLDQNVENEQITSMDNMR